MVHSVKRRRYVKKQKEGEVTKANATLMSDTTLGTAVSVEWCGRYADCVLGNSACINS